MNRRIKVQVQTLNGPRNVDLSYFRELVYGENVEESETLVQQGAPPEDPTGKGKGGSFNEPTNKNEEAQQPRDDSEAGESERIIEGGWR